MKDIKILIADVLLCASVLAGCTEDTQVTTQMSSEETSDVTEYTSNTTEPSGAQIPEDLTEQLGIIEEAYSTWAPKLDIPEDYDPGSVSLSYHNYAFYAVTDLDGDLLLEIVVSEYDGGSGDFSRFWIYEVNEEGGIELIGDDPDPDFFMADLFEMDEIDYYLDENGVRWNLASDSTLNGSYGSVVEYQRISISDGLVIETICRKEHCTYQEDYYIFYDGDGNEISEDEFEELYETYYLYAGEGTDPLGWMNGDEDCELIKPDVQDLWYSYMIFAGA